MRKAVGWFIIYVLFFSVIPNSLHGGEDSLFRPEIAQSPLAEKTFSFMEKNREKVIDEWIRLTEIPAPSGDEKKRAKYIKKQFCAAGLDLVFIDDSGNVVGIWEGTQGGKKVILSAHMDTVFPGVKEIKVKREGNLLKAPGIGDDTASLINLLWSIRALKKAGFAPKNTYYFLATVEEEAGLRGMRAFLDKTKEKFDFLIALDGDLGNVNHGSLGFGGGRVIFRGPGAHTLQSRGVPDTNLAVAKAVERVCEIELSEKPVEKWTVLNIGMIGGGKVRNAVSQESFFTVDLRSANLEELERVENEIKKICQDVAAECHVELEINFESSSKPLRIPGGRESFLIKTVLDILDFLQIRNVELTPFGSSEANVGLEKGILSVNLGRTFGRYKHSLREEAEIDGLFLAMKQALLLVFCFE